MQTREPFEVYAGKLAQLTATRSTCLKKSVGCVIFDANKKLLSTGYNGAPHNMPHCTDDTCYTGRQCFAIHAEQNAITQCKDISNIKTIVTTLFPCLPCAKLILATPCTTLIYVSSWKSYDLGKQLLENSTIDLISLEGLRRPETAL